MHTKRLAPASWAMARASTVLPEPGGPNSSTPLGAFTPNSFTRSGSVMGKVTAWMSDFKASSMPPSSHSRISFLQPARRADLTRLQAAAGTSSAAQAVQMLEPLPCKHCVRLLRTISNYYSVVYTTWYGGQQIRLPT
jgi:hypothetical protein